MQDFGLSKPKDALIYMIYMNALLDLRDTYIYVKYCNTFIIDFVLGYQHYCIGKLSPFECIPGGDDTMTTAKENTIQKQVR